MIDHYPTCNSSQEREQRRAHATASELQELRDDLNYRFRETERRQNVEDARKRIKEKEEEYHDYDETLDEYSRVATADFSASYSPTMDLVVGILTVSVVVLTLSYGVYSYLT